MKKDLALVGRTGQRGLDQHHYEFVVFEFALHFPSSSFSNSQRRASPKFRCVVRSGMLSAAAVSSSVKPQKNFISTTEHQSGCVCESSSSRPSIESAISI